VIADGYARAQTPDVLTPTLALRVQNITLEPTLPMNGVPTAMLSFDVLNAGGVDLSRIVVEVVVLETSVPSRLGDPPTVLAGPFTIIGTRTLSSWQSLHFGLVLRNLSSECDCTANVKVVSARVKRHGPSRPEDDEEDAPLPIHDVHTNESSAPLSVS
jgi:hypothetical protein